MKSFKPESAVIPSGFETTDFRIRMLTINDVVKDYDAVMSSLDHLKDVFGPDNLWPSTELTLEQDLVDLGWHQKEFQIGSSFAYTVMKPDETRCLGCVYVDPSEKAGFDAKVILWVRQSAMNEGLDETLFAAVKLWISEEWWFDEVAFPGRQISWREWEALPEKAVA
ncbi:MAG: GNAT family N-acetyltransferase [Desulfobacteraceae bacterium]|nr:GNAT family N-acetyltransferase [Desulfobacteraceae bacterium]